jgi:hypothetical protein
MGVGPGLCELRRITLLHTPVNRSPTIAYAREQQAGVPKAGGLGRVKNILAASTRQDWEAHGSRLWVRKGDKELKIVDLTDDEGRVELKEEWARSAAGAGSVALRVELSICQGSLLLARSLRFGWTQAGRSYLGPKKTRRAGSSSLAGSMTFAGSSHRENILARTLFAPTCGGRASSCLVVSFRGYDDLSI